MRSVGVKGMCSMAGAAWSLLLAVPVFGAENFLLRETFDKASFAKKNVYDTSFSDCFVSDGSLTVNYSSSQSSSAGGMGCTLPKSPALPGVRTIDLSFAGGGTQMSNSLLIAYAVGPGRGLSLPPFPGGTTFNDRTGYIIRLIHHGDGTNEAKFYRNDTGWVKELKNDWTLPTNPITDLRRVVIRHGNSGEHRITTVFDTGQLFERSFFFEDETYPPNNVQRGIQISAKGHASTGLVLQIRLDTWLIKDFPPEGIKKRKVRK